eukprot:TRINITY_DN40711_c0_g1_i1.p1 TRINITY_DN40711_c0_g1~~TRINITY_DN40711_c0_g1_i1.p1  ORF type:complete len:281 (+),score=31.57 TRINITY_DN40711_c0_g1_i1:77-919(+)
MMSAVRVLTFNIRREGPELDEGDIWTARRQAVADLIRNSGASIVGLQEVKPGQLAFLSEVLSPEYVFVGEGRDADRGGEASPLFVRQSDFAIARHQTYWISQTPNEPGSKHAGAHCPRVVTCAELRRCDGAVVFCFNTHLDHAGLNDPGTDYRVQQEQGEILLRVCDEFCGSPLLPRIVVGDLNSGRGAGAPPVLTRAGYIDASGGDDTPTFVGFDGNSAELTAVYGTTCKATTQIDWIFVKNACARNYEVKGHRYEGSDGRMRYHSDHLAVTADVSCDL